MPRIVVGLESPEVPSQVFVDEARHEDLHLAEIRYGDIKAEQVEIKRFAFTRIDLSGAQLNGLNLEDGSIRGCNLANLRSRSCTVERVQIDGSALTGATLSEPLLRDVVLRDCPIDLSSFRFGHLDRVRFERCRLIEADFQGVTAKACTFIECDLTSAQLSQGNFAGSAFRDCQLAGVGGLEALKGAQMAWQDLIELAATLASSLGIEIRDDIS
jgi:uncharacterized protein YjbI with pentapeptide repeats